METVEVVIRLSKFMYNNVVNYSLCGNLASAVREGTVLPKGHGDLVDMNTVTSTYNLQGELISYDAVVVLEADKEA
jgi:hypothetical protein